MMKYVLSLAVLALGGVIAYDEFYDADKIQYHQLDFTKSPTQTGERWCVIGDGGMGNKAMDLIVESMIDLGCNQVRYLGDLVYPSGIQSVNDPLFTERFLKPITPLLEHDIPVYLLLGNHDWKGNPDAWFQVAEKVKGVKKPYFHYAEARGDVCVFNIETTWYEKLYFAHKRMPKTDWLMDAYDAANEHCQFSIAFGHHPLISSGKHDDALIQTALFLESNVFGHVDMYIAGHDHIISDEGEIDGTTQLISGSASKVSSMSEELNPAKRFALSAHGFLTLDFRTSDDGIWVDYTFYKVEPESVTAPLTRVWEGSRRGTGIRNFEEMPY